MIEKSFKLNEVLHLEPITEMALQRYNVSFQNGTPFLKESSLDAFKDVDFVIDLMTFYASGEFELERMQGYSFSVILDYLQRTHQFYIDRMLPKMEMAIHSISKIFPNHPSAIVLSLFFANYRNELLEHIELEEKKLFPYAVNLYDGKIDHSYSVKSFKDQHNHDVEDHLESIFEEIRAEFPEVARSFAYRTFKHLIDHFQHDLSVHHLIEEKVFLQKVVDLELSV